MLPPIPSNQPERLAALHRLDLLDTPPGPACDRLTRLAATALDVPMALISLIDEERQWVKSRFGVLLRENPAQRLVLRPRDRCRPHAPCWRCDSRSTVLRQSLGRRRSACPLLISYRSSRPLRDLAALTLALIEPPQSPGSIISRPRGSAVSLRPIWRPNSERS